MAGGHTIHNPIHHHNPNPNYHRPSSTQPHSTTTTTTTATTTIEDSYKLEKQAFVSDLTGGSLWKINAVSLTAVIKNLRFGPKSTRTPSILSHLQSHFYRRSTRILHLDLPILLANTLLAHHILLLNFGIICLILTISRTWPSLTSKNKKDQNINASNRNQDGKKKHKKHWSKKFSSDEEGEFELEENEDEKDGFNYNDSGRRRISFEDEKLARHSRGESLTKTRLQTHSRIPSLISEENHYPFRISVDSTADLARFNVNPPTTYLPPGSTENNDSSFSHSITTTNPDESFSTSITPNSSRQVIRNHYSRDSLNSHTSGFSNQNNDLSNDLLRSTLPPLSINRDEEFNDKRQSLASSTSSSHSNYASPIESSTSSRIGSVSAIQQIQDRIGRVTSPLSKIRSSNPTLSSSYGEGASQEIDQRRSSDAFNENRFHQSPSQSSYRNHHQQQFSTSSTSSYSSNFNSSVSPSRPPSAPPITTSPNSNSNRQNRIASNPINSDSRRFVNENNAKEGIVFSNSEPNSPPFQNQSSLNQNSISSIEDSNVISNLRTIPTQDQESFNQSNSNSVSIDQSNHLISTNLSNSNPTPTPLRGTTIKENANPFVSPQPFLTIYRSHMMLMTIICILAVDFKIFPREFAKCETFGKSLMDLGVGSFVFSLGLISALPILKSPRTRFKPLKTQFLVSLRKSFPILLIGGIRVLLVKGVDYHEHLSEYGLHWNFFITLGLLPIFIILLKPFSKHFRFINIGFFIGLFYQSLLFFIPNFQSFLISNDLNLRNRNLLNQNKEGIFSLFGYLSIFLFGLDLGFYILPLDPYFIFRKLSKSRKKPKTEKLIMILLSFSFIWWFLHFMFVFVFDIKVSRRLANFSYVVWVVAFNTNFILAYTIVYWFWLKDLEEKKIEVDGIRFRENNDEKIDEKEDQNLTPKILEALNNHSFIIFLVANLLTGLINLSIKTIHTNSFFSIIILTIYLSLCLGLAVVMQQKGWKVRL